MLFHLPRLGFSHDHHHRRSRQMSSEPPPSLASFRSLLSGNLNRVSESLKLGSEFLSLRWIHQCFEMIPIFNTAFAKLMVEIDYPASSWEAASMDEYFDYTINLLQLLNSISSSLSHLNQDRVSLSHALSLMESSPDLAVERMTEIRPHHDHSIKGFKFNPIGGDHDDAEKVCSNGKERIFHEAILILRSSGFWVCGVVLSGLKSEVVEMMRGVAMADSWLMGLDSIFRKKMSEEGGFVKEVEGVNEIVRLIRVSSDHDAAKELQTRLEVLGNALKSLREEEEDIFGKVLAARNEVLDTLRRNHNYNHAL